MAIRNLTSHEIALELNTGYTVHLRPVPRWQGPRVTNQTQPAGYLPFRDGKIELRAMTEVGKVENLPPQTEDILIVPSVIALAARDRGDLFIPDEPRRDERGQPAAARSLRSVAKTVPFVGGSKRTRRSRTTETPPAEPE